MKVLIFLSTILLLGVRLEAQEYLSFIMVDDTITESADHIMYHENHIYTMSLTRCQPNAQSCALLRKFDLNLNPIWSHYFPQTTKSNENGINILNDSTLIIVGRNNSLNQKQAFYHHIISTNGEVLGFIEHQLPYESNITLGSQEV